MRRALWAVILASGPALGGLFIGHGFASGRAADRYVEVKGQYGIGGPTFVFTRLNELKPLMVKAATANARAAAEQFAAGSRTALGGIRHANQGVFVILPRDQAPGVNEGAQLQKIVRVVSTVQYFLK